MVQYNDQVSVKISRRWPSARPDDVVVVEVPDSLGPLKAIAASSSYMDMLDTLPRQSWTRLMRETPDSEFYFLLKHYAQGDRWL